MKISVVILSFWWATVSYCEQKPLMPVQEYLTYRRAKEFCNGSDATQIALKRFRLPTEEEMRAYLYSDYCSLVTLFDNTGGEVIIRANMITWLDIDRLCKWLIKDDPRENIPYVIGFINDKNREFEEVKAEYISKLNEKKGLVGRAIFSLGMLEADAMPYFMEFLKSDSEIVCESACLGVSELFKNKDISEETKREWINALIEVIWPAKNTPCRNRLIQELLYLDQEGYAPMNITDWVSICFGETDIGIYESVYSMYPKEFREWEKKEGGFRPLVWE